MKKLSIYLLALCGLMAASCAEDIEPAKPQTNPQEPTMNAAKDVKCAPEGALTLSSIALEDYNEPEAKIPVMKLEEVKNLPEGASIVFKLQLSATEDFAKSQTLIAEQSADDATLYVVDAAQWQEAQVAIFGNSIKPQTCYYRVPIYISLEGTEYRLDSTSYYAVEGDFEITRMYPGYVVEEAYYVYGSFVGNNSIATAVEMLHGDNDVYDDPNFNYIFEVSEQQATAGYTLRIVPGSARGPQGEVGMTFGTSTPDATSGELILGGQPITIYQAGPFKLEVNMKELTYTIAAAPATLYIATSGAMFANVKCLQIPTKDYQTYEGLAYINTQFVAAGQKSYNPLCYGADVTDGPAADAGDIFYSRNFIKVADSKNVGLYWTKINVVKMTYELKYIKTLGVTGKFSNWGKENPDGTVTPDIEMTHDNNYQIWTATVTIDQPGEWKIRANNAWNISFGKGGNEVENQVDFNGGDLTFEEAGTYEIVFNCSKYPYTLTYTKK